MANLIELTAQIVSAHIYNKQMTSEEMYQELQLVHASLQALETSSIIDTGATTSIETPKLSIKQAFKKNEVICLICGKGGFKTLKRHLGQAHNLKPGQYRKQFNIPSTQSLTAKSYSESRRQLAIDKGLGEGLAKARADKKAPVPVEKIKTPIMTKKKATAPAKKINAPLPAVKEKVAVPAVRTKAPVPVVKTKAAVPAKTTK